MKYCYVSVPVRFVRRKRMSLKDFELHVTEPEEILKRWGKSNPEAVRNTKELPIGVM